MKTRVITVDADHPASDPLDEAASVLSRGGLVAFATETVYGLGAVATDPAAVAGIFKAKGRPSFNPLIVHVSDISQARECAAEWPETAQRLAERFWPGPLTIVLPRSAIIPDIVTGGRDTVGLRVPVPKVARGLIERVGKPVAAPSANRSNRISPTRAEHVLADLDGRIDLILDSGPTRIGLESTVLDLTVSPPRILRPGPLGRVEIEACLKGLATVEHLPSTDHATEAPASPGMQPVHYAPRTPALRVDSAENLEHFSWPERAAVVVLGTPDCGNVPANIRQVALGDPESAARRLYELFHQLDACGLDLIVVVMPPDRPEWRAIRDRLLRATRPAQY